MNIRNALAAVSAGILAVGCTLGPSFTRPEPPAGGYVHSTPAPTATRSVTYGADVADGWYGLFHSDNLDRLVRMALAGNPDLEAARHGLKAAQYELQAVAGTQLPQIDASGQIARANINGSLLLRPAQRDRR